ncbi:MAG: class I SAM-dependent RNA methyltransferase [Alphaproteobacteria bacterium]|nr:class I SAM-dependent RNA methyltransferase [Alphaproteobacteria bacterium]
MVERVGAQGDGIAQHRGEPVFLPFAAAGDRVRARLGAKRGGGREGRTLERLVAGPDRVEPPCPHFGVCGGCTLQHLNESAYRSVKLGALHAALARVGIDPGVVAPLRAATPGRRRARIGIEMPHDTTLPVRIGFRERFQHRLVDINECRLLEPALFRVVVELRRAAAAILRGGMRADAILTRTDSGIDLLIEAAERPTLGALGALAGFAEECDLARVVWRISGDDLPVIERRPPRVVLSGVAVPFPPGGFLQASEPAERILVAEVLRGAGLRRPVLDLFAGLGTFTFPLAAAGSVHAVEGDERAAAALARGAAAQPRVSVERRDLMRDTPPPEWLSRYAAAVFDPPRAGAARLADALARAALETVVAISCNPATFVRDAARLIAGGYRLERVIPIDQFVWTAHLELVAVFRH